MEPQKNICDALHTQQPYEICLTAYSFLDRKSLGRCCQVSKNWKLIFEMNLIWQYAYPGIQYIKPTTFKGNFKKYIKHRNLKIIKSKDKLPVVFLKFCKASESLNFGSFHCSFPFNNYCFFKAAFDFEWYNDSLDKKEITNTAEYMLSEPLPIDESLPKDAIRDLDWSNPGQREFKFNRPLTNENSPIDLQRYYAELQEKFTKAWQIPMNNNARDSLYTARFF